MAAPELPRLLAPEKSYRAWAKQLGLERSDFGIFPGIIPVTIVDDDAEFAQRAWPFFEAGGTQAAIAAVYSIIGLQAISRPLKIIKASVGSPGGVNVYFHMSRVDPRTANQATITPLGFNRGGSGATALCVTGTSAAAFPTGSIFWWAQGEGVMQQDPDPFTLMPGEGIYLYSGTVLKALAGLFLWEELLFPVLPGTPF